MRRFISSVFLNLNGENRVPEMQVLLGFDIDRWNRYSIVPSEDIPRTDNNGRVMVVTI